MLPETITLETERLLLQEITPELYNLILSTYSDDDIKKAFGYRTDNDVLKEKQRYAKGIVNYYHTFKRFVLTTKEDSLAIGQCGYHKWYAEHNRAEIGYGMSDISVMNKGYMREAIAPIVAYGFNNMQLNRIEACISPKNKASIKLVERLGFKYEGLMREHYANGGVIEDSANYSLLRKEFNQLGK